MSHVHYHAESSARQFGGTPGDYQAIHAWFDATKIAWCDSRHRALRHHDLGVIEAERRFGATVTISDGVEVPTRAICERHLLEDCGRIPTLSDWFEAWDPPSWVSGVIEREDLAARSGCDLASLSPIIDYFVSPVPVSSSLMPEAMLALQCHSFGVFAAEARFGITVASRTGRIIPVRVVAERIVAGLCGGRVPCVSEWLGPIRRRRWMNPGYRATVP
ncbi:MAG: hypothetical protein WBF53_13555 [Litorimonas sp.]